jgi:hypothetical protein
MHDQRNLCHSGGKELSMIIHKSFRTNVKRQFNLACDQSGQYAQKYIKEDDVKQRLVAGKCHAQIPNAPAGDICHAMCFEIMNCVKMTDCKFLRQASW